MENEKDKVEVKTAWRFFRSNLSTVVWDPRKGMNKPLANFSKGHFTTEDKAVADILRKKGYIEIPLNMEKPPAIVVEQPAPQLMQEDVPVLKNIENLKGEAAEAAAQKAMDGIVQIPEVQASQPLSPSRVKSSETVETE